MSLSSITEQWGNDNQTITINLNGLANAQAAASDLINFSTLERA